MNRLDNRLNKQMKLSGIDVKNQAKFKPVVQVEANFNLLFEKVHTHTNSRLDSTMWI